MEKKTEVQQNADYITINDVAKVQLLVGTIADCDIVPTSDKLLRLQVDFGQKGMRQILAGVRKFYEPEDLIGQQGVFIFNLKPRDMAGLESHGMMLFAEDEQGRLQMVTVRAAVPDGSPLR